MEKGINKDWMDAVREQCLSDGTAPAPGSWEAVGAKMRRAAARRRGAVAAAVLLPAIALMLWSPWRQVPTPSAIPAPQLAESSENVPSESPASLRSESLVAANPSSPGPTIQSSAVLTSPSFVALTGESPAAPVTPDPVADPVSPGAPSSKQAPAVDKAPAKDTLSSKTTPDETGHRILLALNDPKPRQRSRVSIGLRAGSGPTRRDATVSLQSAPYVAALNLLNIVDPSLAPGVKSSADNLRNIGAVANSFFAASSAGQYAHDLPLSLGLSVRVELTPRTGLETGVEYTYLHSVEEFAGSQLNQRLHFIGIPVRLETALWTRGAFDLYAGLGGKVEKCVSASMGRVVCEESRLQLSAEAFGGIQYQLHPRMHLYFQPALSWYFTKTDLVTYRTEHPLGLTLHAGLRFDL